LLLVTLSLVALRHLLAKADVVEKLHFIRVDMDQVAQFVDPLRQFSKDSIRLVKRCTKPDRKGKLALMFRECALIALSIVTVNALTIGYRTQINDIT
jgi:preprotein translocase subunit Sss1